jgi:hypothetical protein
MIGLVTCSVLLHRRPSSGPRYSVEIVVHGPDGKIIPAVRRVGAQ